MIIDAHTHIWPDSIAARAIAGTVPGLEAYGDGTVAGLRRSMASAGIDRSVSLGVANNADQVEKVCKFAASLDAEHFIGLGAIHPGLSPEDNVTTLHNYGLIGVKVHPLFQGFTLDDPLLPPIFEAMDPGMVVVVHVGGGGSDHLNAGCTPTMIRDIARAFPSLNFVACHFGGYRQFEEALDIICGEPITVDTSWPPSLTTLDRVVVRRFIAGHGVERVVFASDWPMADQQAEIDAVTSLKLGDDDTDAILGGNMIRVLQAATAGGAL